MKELSLKEKARAYDKVLKEVKDFFEGRTKMYSDVTQALEFLFPELKENEDERIRKWIINEIKIKHHNLDENNVDFVDKAIAWLEKQGEQKTTDIKTWKYIIDAVLTAKEGIDQYLDDPWTTVVAKRLQERFGNIKQKHIDVKPHIPNGSTDYDKGYEEAQRYLSERGFDIPWNDGDVFVDERYITQTVANVLAWGDKHPKQNLEKQKPTLKTEPKFKVGDWITGDENITMHIVKVGVNFYEVEYVDGSIAFPYMYNVDKNFHLWTIDDAKDGDVLFHSDSASNGTFIFKKVVDVDGIKDLKEILCHCDYDSEDHFCLGEHHTCCWADAIILHPATKEQRDLLFQKMKEAGYEWNAEKKELKRIEQDDKEFNHCCEVCSDNRFEIIEEAKQYKPQTWMQEKLLTEKGYMPYCGNPRCREMPRTQFNGKQFYCRCCRWESSYSKEFIEAYKKKWNLR